MVDAGILIPNINDHFRGDAPDCGAYEAGQELPHYGPRHGKLVFEDDLSRGLQNWVVEKFDRDEVDIGYSGNRMMVSTQKGVDGVMVWCKHQLPDNFMVEYDITPVSESGFYLMFFCAEEKTGKIFWTILITNTPLYPFLRNIPKARPTVIIYPTAGMTIRPVTCVKTRV